MACMLAGWEGMHKWKTRKQTKGISPQTNFTANKTGEVDYHKQAVTEPSECVTPLPLPSPNLASHT